MNSLSEPASLFPLNFRLISGHEGRTRPVQAAAVSAPSVGLDSGRSQQIGAAVVLSSGLSLLPSKMAPGAIALSCRWTNPHNSPASAVSGIHWMAVSLYEDL